MARAIDRLEREYQDVIESSEEDFLWRLRDYVELLKSDKRIAKAVAAGSKEVEDAEAAFSDKDDEYIAELVALRNELVELEPDLDDSDQEKPPKPDELDRVAYDRFDKWKWTLANFDAVAESRPEGIIEDREMDNSPSRMLAEILRAKLFDLVHGDASKELKDLNRRVNFVANRESADFQRLERVAEESGFLPLKRVEAVADHLAVQDPKLGETPEEKHAILEAGFRDALSGFHHLREAMRPREARGSLSGDAKDALGRQERESQTEIKRLHRALRKKLETGPGLADRFWRDLTRNEKWTAVGALAGVLAIPTAIVIAIVLSSG